MGDRVYLDWNATAPLRPEARAAMIKAMDIVGNPSSVHSEGRAAKMIVEKAREQVATLVGCGTEELVFTSGATEISTLLLNFPGSVEFAVSAVEHDSVWTIFTERKRDPIQVIGVDSDGLLLERHELICSPALYDWVAVQTSNSETGIKQSIGKNRCIGSAPYEVTYCDSTQTVGKEEFDFAGIRSSFAGLSGHKFGGPKGAGALLVKGGEYPRYIDRYGSQEKGRRAGTENVIGIAGFGAAAEAAQRDLDAGAWEPIEELRNDLESTLRDCAGDDLIIFGENAPRLPNTSCFAIPGWKGETQVMQLDLAGFAVSAGSACSSGKVGPSRVLKAMGFDDITASSAIRVSMGQATTKDEVSRFIDAWTGLYKRMKTRAA